MSTNDDLVECLLRKELFLLAMVFMNIDHTHAKILCKVIHKELGLDIENINNIYGMTDEEINKLKKFEVDKKEYLLSSAHRYPRTLYPEVDKITKELNFKYIMSFILTLAILVYIFAVTFIDIPTENKGFVNTTVGMLISTVFGVIISYYYKRDKKHDDNEDKK